MRHACARLVGRLVLVAGLFALVSPLAPRPVPAGASAVGSGPVIVSPEPGSRTAVPTTQISFLGRAARTLGQITVRGSVSGLHAGRLEPYVGASGASFVPNTGFDAGETVTVTTDLPIVGSAGGTFSFVVATPVQTLVVARIPPVRLGVAGVQHFVSAPELSPPALTVTRLARVDATGLDDLVLAPKGPVGAFGPMLTDAAGQLIYFRPLSGVVAMNADIQRYEGAPVLTWWQGKTEVGHGDGVDVIVDSSYRTVAIVHAGNAAEADLHEFTLVGGDAALITADQSIRWDLRSAGGRAYGTAWDGIVQEINVPTGLVMLQWDSLDHVPVANSYFKAPPAENSPFDFFHINAVQLEADGDLLVSSRNTSAIYQVAPADDGRVVWELGGKESSFSMGPGTHFVDQHDARIGPGGLLTIFDNESVTNSRALELQLDLKTRRATLLHAYLDSPPTKSYAFGDVQHLTGGGLLVSWGTAPDISVLSSSGALVEQIRLPTGDDTYRTFTSTWNATPTTAPAIAVRTAARDRLEVLASWNGATAVVAWRILEGASAHGLHPVATGARRGFETAIGAPRAAFVAAQALSASGAVLGTSAVLRSGAS